MRELGIAAIAPTPRLSLPDHDQRVFPYLLQSRVIAHPNQVWCSDITYIRVHRAFVYLTVIMDWFSRYVLAYEVSLSLVSDFCIQTLHQALTQATPAIFNSDHGESI